ncbi:MAG TPA: S41 family peptidase [Pyrinomonadaceae bacterium]|nr:S41 family peptidase [Pyrinomonadaceae bacterium]
MNTKAARLSATLNLILLVLSSVWDAEGYAFNKERLADNPAQAASAVSSQPGLMHFPAISRTHVAFVYANDIWVASRTGGPAVRLTHAPGAKYRLAFSPDGRTIAFSANLESNPNIYTIPTDGGTPARITHLPFNVNLCQWTPRGELLFYTDSLSFNLLAMQLFTVRAGGGVPAKLPVPYGSEASLSADGEWLAYTPNWPQTNLRQARKRYVGGIAPDIWLFNLRTHAARKITDWQGTDNKPMWHGETVYYLSDAGAEHRLNIWAYDTRDGLRRQVTAFDDYDVNNPSINSGPGDRGEIVFQHGPDIRLLDLKTGRSRRVEISIPPGEATLKPREVDASKFITSSELSTGDGEVLLGARGDIWMLPVAGGAAARNLSRTSGAFERDPALSPDGRRVAYFSDATGEYELYVTRADGKGETRRLTALGPGFRYGPRWSPDSAKIGFTDHAGIIYIHTLADGETKRIDAAPWAQQTGLAWSHDSTWLAYTKLGENRLSSVWLYDTTSGERRQVGSGMFNESSPVFDRRGDYLFFISERNFTSPAFDSLNRTFTYTNTGALVAVPLREAVASPPATLTTEANGASSTGSSSNNETQTASLPNSGKQPEAKQKSLIINLEELARRAVVLPTQRGAVSNLDVTEDGSPVYVHTKPGGESSIRIFNLAAGKKEEQTVLEGESDFQLSTRGRKALVRKGGALYVIDAAPGQKLGEPIGVSGMTVPIDARAEWQQIFNDTWRLFRDFYYAPNMQGVDWPRVRRQYQLMLDRAVTREDVNYVIGEMIAELNTGHAWIANPGDVVRAPAGSSVAMLGADFAPENGAYRITELYEGAAWDAGARNPLRQAGVRKGDYLLAVDGAALDTNRDPLAALLKKANTAVTLTVGDRPVADASSRRVVVRPLPDDSNLRYRAWVERNRALVERRTGGQVGYIHLTDFGFNGLNELIRQFHGQVDKKALIIDPRWSQGGFLGDVFVRLLDQPDLNYYAERYSDHDWPVPSRSLRGPKCVLVNHLVISAGENFTYYFRKLGLGKVIGTRTWGGLVGLNGNPSLIDGGYVNVPNAAFFSGEGKWLIENRGVEPDIEVLDDPSLMAGGADPQLDAAIKLMLQEIERNPRRQPRRPAYPDRSRMSTP